MLSHYELVISKDLSVLELERFRIRGARYPRSCVYSEVALEGARGGRTRPLSPKEVKPYSHYGERQRVEVMTRIYQLLKETPKPDAPDQH